VIGTRTERTRSSSLRARRTAARPRFGPGTGTDLGCGHDMEEMHTSSELSEESFQVRIDDRTGSWRDLFPGFDEHDRIGLVVSTPHGALGASLLYLAAVHAFYELCRDRSDEFWIYPDFFFFHVGTRLGHHGSLDVWPDHKEVLVEADGDRLVEAVNDRAITRLVVPEGLGVGRPEQREGLASYAQRMRGAFVYSSSGRTTNADVSIRGDDTTARYAANVLDPASRAAELGASYVASIIRAHLGEVSQETRDRVRRERQALLIDGRACETYRRITPEDALEHFAARPGKSDSPPVPTTAVGNAGPASLTRPTRVTTATCERNPSC
jgi:hypothetical protein